MVTRLGNGVGFVSRGLAKAAFIGARRDAASTRESTVLSTFVSKAQ
jgi:hypothetical protein